MSGHLVVGRLPSLQRDGTKPLTIYSSMMLRQIVCIESLKDWRTYQYTGRKGLTRRSSRRADARHSALTLCVLIFPRSESDMIYCDVCSVQQPILRSRRCETCKRLITQASNTGATGSRTSIPAAIAVVAIRESVELHASIYPSPPHGYACHYTQIQLETENAKSRLGSYGSFDHTVPNDAGRAVLCSRIINDIKGWMTDTEFYQFVCDTLDVHAPRKIHGLTIPQTHEFLVALKEIMSNDSESIANARDTVHRLSGTILY